MAEWSVRRPLGRSRHRSSLRARSSHWLGLPARSVVAPAQHDDVTNVFQVVAHLELDLRADGLCLTHGEVRSDVHGGGKGARDRAADRTTAPIVRTRSQGSSQTCVKRRSVLPPFLPSSKTMSVPFH